MMRARGREVAGKMMRERSGVDDDVDEEVSSGMKMWT